MTFLPYLLFAAGFVLLIKGAGLLVDGASSIARRFKVSDLVIGLTVVAFGTSCPELFVNLVSSVKGSSELAFGNVLGSNIANILLILGVASVIRPLDVTSGTVWKEIPFGTAGALLLGVLANDFMTPGNSAKLLSRVDGLILLTGFAGFLVYSWRIAGRIEGLDEHVTSKERGVGLSLLMVILGLAGLTLGGKWIVDGAVKMALQFGLSESLIGLTLVAVGTSLPELATSAVAARRGNVEIAVGNVVGSNIFNIYFVLGTSAAIRPLPFLDRSNFDLLAVIGASSLLFLTMFTGRRRSIDRWEGVVLLLLYAGYTAFIIWRG
jgi:cation:H+ antiporter